MKGTKATFFETPADFHQWLAKHHAQASELLVGLRKKDSGKPSITWPESVDEALCFGWIDGIRRTLDETSYTIRFTPRRPGSKWSAVNIRRARELIAEGRMAPAGLAAFGKRVAGPARSYVPSEHTGELPAVYGRELKANREAWDFFRAQAPSYRKKLVWWVTSAKNEATRLRRLERLIEASAGGRRLV